MSDATTNTTQNKIYVSLLDLEHLNYSTWREMFTTQFIAFDVINHIDETTPKPTDAEWTNIDSLVKLWLYGSVNYFTKIITISEFDIGTKVPDKIFVMYAINGSSLEFHHVVSYGANPCHPHSDSYGTRLLIHGILLCQKNTNNNSGLNRWNDRWETPECHQTEPQFLRYGWVFIPPPCHQQQQRYLIVFVSFQPTGEKQFSAQQSYRPPVGFLDQTQPQQHYWPTQPQAYINGNNLQQQCQEPPS
ncbi:hypothetical protein LXL04_000797 [Taraxacum kok-saghyz]